jgi:hypothetical protein
MRKEMVILHRANEKRDFKILDKETKKEIGFILETADGLGFELYPNFKVPQNYEFPQTARSSMEALAIFNKYYQLTLNM